MSDAMSILRMIASLPSCFSEQEFGQLISNLRVLVLPVAGSGIKVTRMPTCVIVIYKLRDKLCKTIPASQMTITQVGILVTFMPDPGTGKKNTRSFDVNWPNSCSLKHDGKDAIIRKMLIASGIEPRAR